MSSRNRPEAAGSGQQAAGSEGLSSLPAARCPLPAARPWSLAARLTAWYAGAAFLLVALASVAMDFALARQLDREQDELLADKARLLTQLLRERPDDLGGLKPGLALEGEGARVEV